MEVTRCHPMPMPMPYGEARDISVSAAEICSHILVCTQSIPRTLGILEDKFKTEKLKTLHVESWAWAFYRYLYLFIKDLEFFPFRNLLTLGTFSLWQTPSESSLSLISHENTLGHSCLYSEIFLTTAGVEILGLDPPISRGLIDPVS